MMDSPGEPHFIGFDLSLVRSGYAVLDERMTPRVGVCKGGKQRGAPRLAALRAALLGVIPQGPAVVAVEGYAMAAKGNTFDIGELGGVVRLALYERPGTVVLIVPPANLKQFATGKGNAKKDAIISAVNREWGLSISDDNEADALILARMALCWYRREALEGPQENAMKAVIPYFPVPDGFRPVRRRRRNR